MIRAPAEKQQRSARPPLPGDPHTAQRASHRARTTAPIMASSKVMACRINALFTSW
jgi:hypothetical protein